VSDLLRSHAATEQPASAAGLAVGGPVQAAWRDFTLRYASVAGAAALAAFSTALFLFHLGAYGLWEPDEARYAEIAREMIATRDFILPHLNYVAYVEKPPLLYWLTALSFAVFGQNEFAARFVPAIAAIAGVLATYFFALRVFDRRRALLAGGILATTPLYAVMAQVLTTDILLTAFVTVAIFSFFLLWWEDLRWRWVFYGAMGFGTLTKGPVAIVLPVLIALAFLLWQQHLRVATLARLRLISGFIATSIIAAPWFVAISIREPNFFGFYFFGEHLRRFFESSFSHGEPIYFYAPVLVAGMLPWSVIVPFAWSDRTPNREARDFCLIAGAVVFAFFSIASGKLIPYILPAVPPLVVAIADILAGCVERADSGNRVAGDAIETGARLVPAVVIAILAAAALVVWSVALHNGNPYLLATRPALLLSGITMAIGAAVVGILLFRRQFVPALTAIILASAATLVAATYGRLEAEPLRSYAWLGREIAERAPDATPICYHRYVQSLAFYCKRRVILVGPPSELRFGRDHSSDARTYFLSTDKDLLRLWNAPGAKVLVIDEPDLDRLKPRLGDFAVIASEARKRAIMRIGRPQ
jgi:4-amino-4-deoxy-L-arabinose transferase-like glycosyltransferase